MGWSTAYNNTATSPATVRDLDPEPVNWGADFRVSKETGSEAIFTNISCPVDKPETIRVAFAEIKDVFKGTPIDPTTNALAPTGIVSRGCSVLVQLNMVVTGEDSVAYPVSAHLVLKLPYGAAPSADNVSELVQRLMGTLYDTGETAPDTRLEGLIRGAMTPPDL